MMKLQTKQKLVKAYILFCGVWGILVLFFLWSGIGYNEETGSNNLAIIVFILWGFWVIIMIILMAAVPLDPEVTEAEKMELKISDYNDFEKAVEEKLYAQKFKMIKYFEENEYGMKLYVKTTISNTYVAKILIANEFTDIIHKDSIDKTRDFLSDEIIDITSRDFNVIDCFCANKGNEAFTEFVNKNVKQEYRVYQLPAGVLFDEKAMYIAVQKGGWFIARYHSLKRMLKKLTIDIMIEE